MLKMSQILRGAVGKRPPEPEIRTPEHTSDLENSVAMLQKEIATRRKAEDDLRQLKEFNESIVQNMAEGIMLQDTQGNHTFVNPAAASLLGYTGEELKGRHWTEIVPPDQRSIIEAADKLRLKGLPSRYGVELLSKDGRRIPVQISGSTLSINGTLTGTLAVFTDISELKKAEEQRRRREAQNSLIYKVGQNIGSKLDLQILLAEIVTTIRDAFNYYGVMLLLTEEDGRHLRMKTIAGGYAQIYPENRRAVFGEGIIGFSASSGITQVSGDVSKDPHYIQWSVEKTKSELSVPIKSGGRVIGVLDIQSDEFAAFSETDGAAMETLATQIATAIEHAKLYEQAQREIVERRQAEEDLRRLKEFNEGIVQNMAEGIVVKNTEGCFTFLNPATVSLLGYASEELLGRHWRMIFPPDQYLIVEAADKLREQGLASRYEVEMLSKDGRRLPVQISGSPVMKNGTFTGTIVVFTDISELKKAEEQRRRRDAQNALIYKVGQNLGSELELEALLAEIVNSVHDAFNYYGVMLLLTDVSGRHLKMKTIAGGYAQIYPKDHITVFGEGMIGRSASSGITQVSGDVDKNAHYVRWTEEKTNSELSVPIKIGEKVIGVLDIQSDEYDAFNETDVAAMETLATQIAAAIANAKLYDQAQQEILERQQAEEKLKKTTGELTRSNKELELFAYIASHDLQEPLRMIGSYVQLLARRYKGKLDADAEEFIGFAVDGATRMQRMINDLLTYSRVGTKGKPLVPTDLEKVLKQAESNLLVAVEESGAAITHDPLPAVTGDETQLIQLFQNLIGNAVKFRLEGKPPAVHVSAGEKDDEWVLSIRDNGIGIGSQYFERIFQIFQRLHERSKYAGTGIGLAVCRRIVERHGGHIWVESEPGCGATFFLTIPKRRLTT